VITIVPGTLRDLSFIASRLREDDRREAEALLGPFHYIDLAAMHLRDVVYVALDDGNPVSAFGASRLFGNHLWTAWSWGSDDIAKAIPTVTRFIRNHMIPELLEYGAHRVEARALASHTLARRWLKLIGATERCELPMFGINGEDFCLFDWTKETVSCA
jgi:hypothetical protein